MRRRIHLLFLLSSLFSLSSKLSSASEIPTVFVIAPKHSLTSNTSGPKTIINQEQIYSSGMTTLAQTLQYLGGLPIQDSVGNGSQVGLSLRGFGSNAISNTVLLINGIPITNPDMAGPDLNIIPVNNIELIEIIAGSESVLYGDQAVGGVINIVTQHKAKQNASLTTRLGSYNQRDLLATVSHHKTQFNFNITVEDKHTDNYRDNNALMNHILLGNINYNYAKGQINVDYIFAHENMEYPGALTALEVKENRRQAVNDINFFKNTNGLLHLQQREDLTSNWHSVIDLAYRNMNGNGILTSPFTQARNSLFLAPKLYGRIKNIALTLGLDLQTDHYKLNSVFGNTKDNLQKYGLFALANIFINEKWNLTLGARGARQNNRLSSFTIDNHLNRALATTLGVTYFLNPDQTFYLRRAESFRFPKADENAMANIGVTGLRTQRGISYETGSEIIQNKYSGKINLFILQLREEISFDPLQTPEQPFGSNTNLDPTVRYGITVSGRYQLHPRLHINAQYNYVHARFQNGIYKGKRIPLVPENILRAGLNWQFYPHFSLYAESIYTGNQFPANDNANISGKIGGYTLCNLNLLFEYAPHLTAAFHLNNIFNKFYYFYTVYQPSLFSQFFYPAPGRNFTFTLNYAFW